MISYLLAMFVVSAVGISYGYMLNDDSEDWFPILEESDFIDLKLQLEVLSDNVKKGEVVVQKMIADAKKHAVKTIKLSPKERSLKIEILIKRFINLDFMARATTGSYWKKATNTQKEKYKSALLKQIVNTIEEHLNTLATLAYKPLKSEARGKKLVYVKGIIKDHSKKIPDVNLLWKLAKDKKGNFLVLDLEIEGISLISSHKAETMAVSYTHLTLPTNREV
mgnify:CR=1 FL=1